MLGNEETKNGYEKGEAILGWSIRNINLVTEDRKNRWEKAPRRAVHLHAVFWARQN